MTIKLCQSSKLPRKIGYVTLSHCWGRESIYTLTSSNLKESYRSIQWDALPRVFQDAAEMALKLGFRYLWIDSLCIIQDSQADWASESSNMGRIYKSAALNIAATGFYNGKNGLFVSRHPKAVLPLRLELSTLYVPDHNPMDSYFMMEKNQWDTQVVESPLNQRGWVFQERLLSPRILHFGNEQLLWECHEMSCSEVFPSGFPHHMENDLKPKRLRFEPSPLTLKRLATIFGYLRLRTYQGSADRFYRMKLYEQWWTSVSTYSAGLLTRSGDKLPALSGAAKEMRALLEDEYVAGMWRKELLKQLLWSIEPKTLITRPSRYRAPSWSWAAVDGQVRMTHPILNEIDVPIAEIIDVVTCPASIDDTGSLSGGHLLVKGPLYEAFPGTRRGAWMIEGEARETRVKFDTRIGSQGDEAEITGSIAHRTPIESNDEYEETAFLEAKEHLDRVYFFPMVLTRGVAEGLMLTPCAGSTGLYTRCGLLEFLRLPEFGNRDHVPDTVVESRPELLGRELYEAYDERGRYTVRIV